MTNAVAYGTLARFGLGAGAVGVGLLALYSSMSAYEWGRLIKDAVLKNREAIFFKKAPRILTDYRIHIICLAIISMIASATFSLSAFWIAYQLGKASLIPTTSIALAKSALWAFASWGTSVLTTNVGLGWIFFNVTNLEMAEGRA